MIVKVLHLKNSVAENIKNDRLKKNAIKERVKGYK